MIVKHLASLGGVDLDHGEDHIRPRHDHLGDREPELRAREVHGHHAPQILLRVCLVDAAVPVGDERTQVGGEQRAHPLRVGIAERLDQLASDAFGGPEQAQVQPSDAMHAATGRRGWP
jgi:hypothetical protein